ncbi:MAG: hypothetical protein SGJ18_02510 [Pseudomonadota bacterium]|nr:hypothetical protein [Pseudomonadota bacterium]
MKYTPLNRLPENASSKNSYKKGDLLVLFGELFNRGYANGLLEESKKRNLDVIYSTVGRRQDGVLRPLNAEELITAPKPILNIPLEAGFDLEPAEGGATPTDLLKSVKMDNWQDFKINWDLVKDSQARAEARIKEKFKMYMAQLEAHIKPNQNVLIAHLMAGGVPRARIFMAVLNNVVKAKGDKFIKSSDFWSSDLGRLSDLNFNDVTANTFRYLVEAAAPMREKLEKSNGSLRFAAYGYHGTEVLVQNNYQWQSYSPYIQGWAKLLLEKYSSDFFARGISTCVYNCPEILTNSSSIFQGVEVPLYPLLAAYKKEAPTATYTKNLIDRCQALLKPNRTLDDLVKITDHFYSLKNIVQNFNKFEVWPQHNEQTQMEALVQCSNELIDMHLDPKNLITFILSEEILKGTGRLILADSFKMRQPVAWLNHDIIVKQNLE